MKNEKQVSNLVNRGNALLASFEQTGRGEDLDAAIQALKDAATALPVTSPQRPMLLNNVGYALLVRYGQKEDIGDLNQAICLLEQAVSAEPIGSTLRQQFLTNFGRALARRYERSHSAVDLDRAVRILQEASDATTVRGAVYAERLSDLALILFERFEHSKKVEDLDTSIAVHEQAAANTSSDFLVPLERFDDLAIRLYQHWRLTGDLRVLSRMLEVSKRLVSLSEGLGVDPEFAARALNERGMALFARYYRFREVSDLSEAVAQLERAVQIKPSPARLGNCASILLEKYLLDWDAGTLNLAAKACRAAVLSAPPDSPIQGELQGLVGKVMRRRYERDKNPLDLAAAIASLENAAKLDWGNRAAHLNTLSICLLYRYENSQIFTDLDCAIESADEAARTVPPTSTLRTTALDNLARGLRLRYTKTGAPEELEHAISAHREAAKIGLDQNPERTLVSARNWLLWAIDRKNWLESSEAYDYAALATEKLYHAQLVRSGKEIWLTKTQGIAACGAYALAQIGKPEEAVVAIERDRARMLSEVLGRDRVGLEELKSQGHADLHARYIQAVDRLSHLAQASSATGEHVSANAAVTDALREAQSELEAAIGAIRQAPGFEGFVHLPNFEDVRAAACDSQLVYVLAGKVGGLALIIPQGGLGPIAAVALPNLTEQTLLEQLQGVPQPASHTYLMAYAAWRNDPLHDETLALRWLNALEATTRWLWDTVMGPIIEAVSPIETVTLVPCGWLGLLPLHAAWTEDPAKPTGRCYALDRVRLRYAPNARALLAAIATSQHDLCGSLLVVEEPQPVSGIPLPNATYEVEMAAASFPQVTTLAREQAKRDKVLQLMRTCSVVHFACHGSADFDEPLKSQLLMANDEALSVRQMLEIRLENARLAVLSACEAGIPGPKLPDEVVGLPAGLFQAGFPGVIAPIWSVADLSTAMLMVRFYAYWRGERLEPIEALRQAQRWLRDTTNEKKVGYFESFLKPSAQDLLTAARIPPRVAGAVTEELRLRSPEKRDFKHPYFWAGFSYTGV